MNAKAIKEINYQSFSKTSLQVQIVLLAYSIKHLRKKKKNSSLTQSLSENGVEISQLIF